DAFRFANRVVRDDERQLFGVVLQDRRLLLERLLLGERLALLGRQAAPAAAPLLLLRRRLPPLRFLARTLREGDGARPRDDADHISFHEGPSVLLAREYTLRAHASRADRYASDRGLCRVRAGHRVPAPAAGRQ